MALLAGPPRPPSYPSGRYTHTNPLRREAGLALLTRSLPDPLRRAIIHAWRHPNSSAQPAPELPNPRRPRPPEASLPGQPPRLLALIALSELDAARRLVEAPQQRILPTTRDTLLVAQGAYLRRVYDALARQIGGNAALAEFRLLVASIS